MRMDAFALKPSFATGHGELNNRVLDRLMAATRLVSPDEGTSRPRGQQKRAIDECLEISGKAHTIANMGDLQADQRLIPSALQRPTNMGRCSVGGT